MLSTPRKIGNFQIIRVLGRGGMGVVYLARDERLGREVALKVLDMHDAPDREQKSRFIREARAAAAIRHPNVATIYDVGETDDDGLPYLAMEYCDGMTLAQLIRRGAVDSKLFLSIARQVADGVSAAHRNGVVHRDIKSANIVLQDDEVVKILDFGLAKKFDTSVSRSSATARFSSSGSAFFGTLPYISPEQAHGQSADQRSDLFSVGVVLYEIATGKLPFDDDSPIILLEKIRQAEPAPFEPLDAAFPPEAASIISGLLQKDPNDRIQRADELADMVRQIEPDPHSTSMPRQTTGKPTTRHFASTMRRKRPKSAFALVAAAVALIIITAIVVTFGRPVGKEEGSVAPGATTPIRSLAVLPFRNISQSTSDAFLSVGLADALVTKLQQIPELNVRPTSAILGFQDNKADMKTAAKELQVEGVLEGHFLSSGDQVRVNLQLTDSRTGYGVWAATVDGRRDNLILLMDQVSQRTATALHQALATKPRTGRSMPVTTVPAAYEEYLQARALIGSHLPADSAKQVAHLERSVELDPRFAAAYAELAIAMSLRQVRGFSNDPKASEKAQWYARQAVRLDPNLAEAHLALGRALTRYRESMRENLAALRLNPNDPQALYTMATYFVATGEPEKTNCIGTTMERIDPSSNDVRTRGYWSVNAVDAERSLEMAKIALAHKETELAGHDMRAQAYLVLGNVAAAEAEQREAAKLLPNHFIAKSIAAQVAAARGDRAAAERHIATLAEDAKTVHWAALRLGLCYAKLGDHARAVEYIDRAIALGNKNWYFMVKHPWLQPLQQIPAFQTSVTSIRRELDDVRDDVIGVYELICKTKTAGS